MTEAPISQPEIPPQPPRETLNWHDVLGAPVQAGEQSSQEVGLEPTAEVSADTHEAVAEVQHTEVPAVVEQVVQVGHTEEPMQEAAELPLEPVIEDTVVATQPDPLPMEGEVPHIEVNSVTEDLIEIATDDPTDQHLVALSQAAHIHGGN